MKFNVLQQDLLPALQAVSRSVGVKATLPVLDNILLSVQKGKLKLAATNLEIGIIKYIQVEAEEEGEITVPAKTLLEIVSGLKQVKVSVTAADGGVEITADKFKAKIAGIPASEFPAIPLAEGKGTKFKKEVLSLCGQILFAAAVDEGRPTLTGILTQVRDFNLEFVATDGFRLAHRQVKLEDDTNNSFKSLIPKKTFEEVLRVLSEEEAEDVEVATSSNQNQIIFSIGKTMVSSRLIEGQFPAWEKTIPVNIICRVLVNKDEFLKAVKLAAIFVKSEGFVMLNVSQEGLSLKSQAKELGGQENFLEASVEGENLEIAFNAKFLGDAITNSPSSQVMLEFSGPLSSALVKPVGVEGLEYIVMPVRLS